MRTAAGGIVIALMVFSTLVSDISNGLLPRWLGGALGWVAVVFLFVDVKKTQRWQTGLITLVGALLLLSKATEGHGAWSQAVGNNSGLVTMLASVGFLRLIALPANDKKNSALPVGERVFIKTLAGVSLFGSVINISAPILFADRLYEHKALNRLASQSITRVFTSTAAWSPFFGGMAAVLTYVPNMRISFVILYCLPFAIIGFIVVVCEARWRFSESVRTFRGYPVNFYNLWIPAALAILILLLSQLAPSWTVLSHISFSALLLTTLVLLWRNGMQGCLGKLGHFITDSLPTMINELQLFLAAGVLAAGLAASIAGEFVQLWSAFSASTAALLLGAMILIAVAGVHPVVTVSGATPLIMTLQPEPELLAVCYLLAWSLGTCASPLSGTHLVFQGRYDIPSWKGAVWNWPYVAFMYLIAVALLYLVESQL